MTRTKHVRVAICGRRCHKRYLFQLRLLNKETSVTTSRSCMLVSGRYSNGMFVTGMFVTECSCDWLMNLGQHHVTQNGLEGWYQTLSPSLWLESSSHHVLTLLSQSLYAMLRSSVHSQAFKLISKPSG
uniref:Uncharacterized protein n=1 Tax=Schistocephalus solidus TaxID=70667 RepID=A0A0V0J5S8_SCHSO